MYTPTTWAAPDKLKHLSEKRIVERQNQIQVKGDTNNTINFKQRITEIFKAPFSFAKTVKVSLSS